VSDAAEVRLDQIAEVAEERNFFVMDQIDFVL